MILPSTTDDAIFDNLPPQDLLRYSRVSNATHEAVSSYIKRTFTLQRILGRYFSDEEILELRHLQYTTGALISGSTALQLFDRSYYPESDLDIYVEFEWKRDIALWFEKKGYTMQPYSKLPNASLREVLDGMTPPANDDPLYPGAFVVLEFLKDGPNTTAKIQLLIAHCPMSSILRFHSTCVMNFIAYDKAYSLYPKGTFTTRETLVAVDGPPDRMGDYNRALQKYKARGWDIIDQVDVAADDMDDPNFPFRSPEMRRVGDSLCWTIPIYPKLELPPSTVEGNTWTLDLSDQYPHNFTVMVVPYLQFRYTVAWGRLPYFRDNLKLMRKSSKVDDQDAELVAIAKECPAFC